MSPSDARARTSRAAPGGAAKRALDLGLGAILVGPGLAIMAVTAALVLVVDGRPVVYPAKRIGQGLRPFTCWKFRTMAAEHGPERGVSGGDKSDRITPLGARLRRSRMDEMPQLLNVFAGQMSLVGPRPPAPAYAERFPELYGEVMRMRPGLTGLATVMFHLHEEWILRDSPDAAETDARYVRRCIPRKARLDLIYRDRWTPWLDLYVLYLTAGRFLPLPGARVRRLRARARRRREGTR